MTNYIYTDKPDQYLHFTYTEKVKLDELSIKLINSQTGVTNEFEMTTDYSPMKNRYNKISYDELIGSTVLNSGSYIYMIMNYELDLDVSLNRINESIIEVGIIHINVEEIKPTEYENTNETDNKGPFVYNS